MPHFAGINNPPISTNGRTRPPKDKVRSLDAESGQRKRKMLDLINRLHNTGVENDIYLPKIVILGNESSGKISLVESLSGITLPRVAGSCARCPTEYRLSHSDGPWQCIVSLHFVTDIKGKLLGQVRNERFGAIIYDKAEVEECIRLAQQAILYPGISSETFLDDKINERSNEELESRLVYSLNTVALEISGPDVVNLSFYDLPELIAGPDNLRGRSTDTALLVRLIITYIRKPSCIILLPVTCETNFKKELSYSLARLHDPEGERTIGVLTTPDRVPAGEEDEWLQFIRSEKDTLKNSWYCIKQPSSNEMKSNPTYDLRKMEDNFFLSKAPWCDLDSIYQKYLRTSNLVDGLSSTLSDLIWKRLPDIQDEVKRSVLSVRDLLPPTCTALEETRSGIIALLNIFTSELKHHFSHESDEPDATNAGLLKDLQLAYSNFQIVIEATRPPFVAFEKQEVKDPIDGYIYIDEVFAKLSKSDNVEASDEWDEHLRFEVDMSFINEFIKEWRAPAQVLCMAVYGIVCRHVDCFIEKHFSGLGQYFAQRIKIVMEQHLNQCFEQAEELVDSLWQREFGIMDKYEEIPFAAYRAEIFAQFRDERAVRCRDKLTEAIEEYNRSPPRAAGKPVPEGVDMEKLLKDLASVLVKGVEPEDFSSLALRNLELVLDIMADVWIYFRVASKNFVDLVPPALNSKLLCGACDAELLAVLQKSLGVESVEGEDAMQICEGPSEERKTALFVWQRAELEKKLERLEDAIGVLRAGIGIER